jgi:hypothetical protein
MALTSQIPCLKGEKLCWPTPQKGAQRRKRGGARTRRTLGEGSFYVDQFLATRTATKALLGVQKNGLYARTPRPLRGRGDGGEGAFCL